MRLGVLRGDGWRDIEAFTDSFAVDPDRPRVEVEIELFNTQDKNSMFEEEQHDIRKE